MERGIIPEERFAGPLDLELTLTSGQSFLWRRQPGDDGNGPWFRTVDGETVLAVREVEEGLEWRATADPTDRIRTRLGLDDDLPSVLEAFPDEPVLQAAKTRLEGLRLLEEPVVPTLFSFILSAQMRIGRIHDLVTALRETYGRPRPFEETVPTFPDPDRLAEATEAELRELGLGYRAPYVLETATMLDEGDFEFDSIRELNYESARERLTQLVGVGPKVADCVLLFGLGRSEPVPLDTWIRTAIEEHFPEADADSYAETSRRIRSRLGPRPGYAQTYVFTHLRTGGGGD
ncbi:MAG: DNA-3-methyladenine glycosylase family protein [Halodesulfurarchaeum sp.]